MAPGTFGNRGRQEKRYANKGGRPAKRPRYNEENGGREVAEADQRAAASEEDGLSQDEEQIEGDSEEETEPVPTSRPYNALLQAFQQSTRPDGRQTKRRKVANGDGADATPSEQSVPNAKINHDDEALDLDDEDLEDTVEDEEEEEEEEVMDAAEEDEDDESDPYELHFTSLPEKELSSKVNIITAGQWKLQKQDMDNLNIATSTVSAETMPAKRRKCKSLKDLRLKKRLIQPTEKHLSKFDILEQHLTSTIFGYEDLLYGGRNPQNAERLRTMASLHALNHIFKGRDRILKNNERLAKAGDSDLELRDQGFTRPKVLILLETRQSCVRYINTLMQLCDAEQQENKKRFEDAFKGEEGKFSEDMPEDFRELFEGNDDNDFRLGIKFTRKTVKFYSQFYASDIILASPLGLRRIIEHEDVKKADSDFLSSIEVAIVDQADAMLMQNWDHVDFVFSHLNLQPKDAHGCDFTRVRNWYLDSQGKYLRQTIIFSAFLTPELNRLFNANMTNIAGKTKITAPQAGAILDTGLSIKQTFSRYDSPSPTKDPDARFNYFTSALIPTIVKTASTHGKDNPAGTLIFIPSYLDFVRVRNYFAASTTTQNISFGAISEYTSVTDARRARSHFVSGRNSVLLYSGRAHHFHRYRIKGVKKAILYALPENPRFYTEVVGGFLGQTVNEGKADLREVSVRAVFSKWDGLRLERVVGSERVRGMLREKGGDTFDFV